MSGVRVPAPPPSLPLRRLRRVEPVLRRACRGPCAVPKGARILVAFSGGADSTALLVGLHQVAKEFGWSVVAAHLHHGLRGDEADRDLESVRLLCERLDVPLVSARWNMRARTTRLRLSGQAGLRRLRQEFLRRAARRAGAVAIATGHNAEDQLETLLLRLGRGTGLAGLGAMSARRGLWIRPLLAASRRDIEEDLRAAGIAWREDRTNADPRYTRNRIRHEALPALLRALGAGEDPRGLARRALAKRVETTLREVRAARRMVERRALRRLQEAGGPRSIDVRPFENTSRLVRAFGLRMAWRRLGTGVGITARHLEALSALVVARGPKRAALPHGWSARREGYTLRFLPPGAGVDTNAMTPMILRVPGARVLGSSRIRGRWLTGVKARQALRQFEDAEVFAAEGLKGKLQVRVGMTDEWFTPYGQKRRKRLGEFLRKQPVAPSFRQRPVVLADRQGILCILGVRRAARAPITSATRKALWIRLEPR